MTLTRKRIVTLLVAFALIFSGAAIMSTDYSYAAAKPAKVTNLTVKKTSSAKAKLSWKKAKNAKKYEIYCGQYDTYGKIKWSLVDTTKKLSYTCSAKKSNYYNYYKVRGVNGSKKGSFSSTKAFPIKKYSGYIVPDLGDMFGVKPDKTSTSGKSTSYYYKSDEAIVYYFQYMVYLEDNGWKYEASDKEGVDKLKKGTGSVLIELGDVAESITITAQK